MTTPSRESNRLETRRVSEGLLVVLLIASVSFAENKATSASKNTDHDNLSSFSQSDGSRTPIRTAADWQRRREQILAGMQEVMGPLPRPKSPVALDVQTLEEHKEDGYVRRKIAYHTDDPGQLTHAWLLLPLPPGEGRGEGALKPDHTHPAILCLHQTTPNGKDSPVGLTDRPALHYAKELAQRGYVTLSPDYPSFGDSKKYNFDADSYVSGTMKAIYDNTRAIDLLQSLPEVDPNRIGCIGHSLGGHNTLFTAAFDTRIKAAVTSCGFTSFHKYKGGNLTGWAQTRYMPYVKTKFKLSPDQMPFDFAEVIAAIAPRGVFVNAPLHDDNFDIDGVREVLNAARPIFKLLGVPDNLQAVHPNCAHDFLDDERQQAYKFLDEHLKPAHKPATAGPADDQRKAKRKP
jgi:predicted dienelactone hydrolase